MFGAEILEVLPRLTDQEAVRFPQALLADSPLSASEVQRSARVAGISAATLQRAKRALGVTLEKVGLTDGWVWSLPSSKVLTGGEGDHEDLRQDVLRLATLLDRPAVHLPSGHTISEGEIAWRAFAARPSTVQLWAAWSALIRHHAALAGVRA